MVSIPASFEPFNGLPGVSSTTETIIGGSGTPARRTRPARPFRSGSFDASIRIPAARSICFGEPAKYQDIWTTVVATAARR